MFFGNILGSYRFFPEAHAIIQTFVFVGFSQVIGFTFFLASLLLCFQSNSTTYSCLGILLLTLLLLAAGLLWFNSLFLLAYIIVSATVGVLWLCLYKKLVKYQLVYKTTQLVEKYFAQSIAATLKPKIYDQNLEHDNSGDKRVLSLLFCDIRKFTLFANNHSSEKTQELLCQYYSEMNTIIEKNCKGTINKLIGDSILAYWDSSTLANHSFWAAKASLEIQEVVQGWKTDSNKISVDVGVGVHTGKVFIGSVGAEDRSDFTVIGPAVNITAKLEQLNKLYQTSVIISKEVYKSIEGQITVKPLGYSLLQGQNHAVFLYEPLQLLDKVAAYSILPSRTLEQVTDKTTQH